MSLYVFTVCVWIKLVLRRHHRGYYNTDDSSFCDIEIAVCRVFHSCVCDMHTCSSSKQYAYFSIGTLEAECVIPRWCCLYFHFAIYFSSTSTTSVLKGFKLDLLMDILPSFHPRFHCFRIIKTRFD